MQAEGCKAQPNKLITSKLHLGGSSAPVATAMKRKLSGVTGYVTIHVYVYVSISMHMYVYLAGSAPL
jgi:hypothetical protein